MSSLYQLENRIQSYAWGSVDGISTYTGIPNPDGKPMAELWMGAHPALPSVAIHAERRMSLDRLIASRPEECLGTDAMRRFGGELPFLFKVLSAAGPLSLQVHPTREQARIGFDRESAEGIPLADPKRNYQDPNPKREILMALSPFTAMCGFREVTESLRLLASVSCPALDRCLGLLSGSGVVPGYVRFYRTLLELDDDARRIIIANAIDESRARVRGLPASRDRVAYELLLSLAETYPADIGILSPLYLNVVDLSPGEALHIPSGIIHSYVRGTGLELMTNSDNTLRCGLTPKHRNVPELYSILEDAPFAPDIIVPDGEATVYRYPSRFPEFALIRVYLRENPDGVAARNDAASDTAATGAAATIAATTDTENRNANLRTGQPAIVLGLSGETEMRADGVSLTVGKGVSVFVPASVRELAFTGEGTAYIATVPEELSDGHMD